METIEEFQEQQLEGEVFPTQHKIRNFVSLTSMIDFIQAFRIESARYQKGILDGKTIYQLQYYSN